MNVIPNDFKNLSSLKKEKKPIGFLLFELFFLFTGSSNSSKSLTSPNKTLFPVFFFAILTKRKYCFY